MQTCHSTRLSITPFNHPSAFTTAVQDCLYKRRVPSSISIGSTLPHPGKLLEAFLVFPVRAACLGSSAQTHPLTGPLRHIITSPQILLATAAMGGSEPFDSKAMPGPPPASSSTDAASSQSASASGIPWVPTLATTSPDNYGGLNPENEASLDFIDGVTGKNFRQTPRLYTRSPAAREDPRADVMSGESFSGDLVFTCA